MHLPQMKSPLFSETPPNPCTHALCECTLTPIYHHPLTDHVIILLKTTTKRWILADRMDTDDYVDDDSERCPWQ